MFGHIVIGIDGHDGGRDAIALAQKLRCVDGELTLAHVYSGDPRLHRSAGTAYRDAQRARSLALLDQARDDAQIAASLRCIEAPSVGRGLHELADRHGADLLVLGSCHRGVLGRVLVGDDTSTALHGARCAVAIAPAGYRNKRGAIREVGVGYDGAPQSTAAIDRAREVARDLGATLSALEVVPASARSLPGDEGIDELVAEAHARIAALEGVDPHAAYGEPAEELARYSASLDLLVVGSRGYRAIGRLIHGSTSHRLAGTARCPLLVMPRADRGGGEVSEDLVEEPAVRGATR